MFLFKSFLQTMTIPKTLIVPCVSASLADCFALDWIIETLGMHRVHVFNSEFVEPLAMASGTTTTAAMELYASGEFAAIQIRSNVLSRRMLVEELMQFAGSNQIEEIVILATASSYLLTGDDLHALQASRVRLLADVEDLAAVTGAGLLKHFEKESIKKSGYVGYVSGMGFQETLQVSRELAARVLGIPEKKLKTPLSVRMLDSVPHMGLSASRCL